MTQRDADAAERAFETAGAMNDTVQRLVEHVRGDRRAQVALAIAIAVNLLILAAYLWSRGGGTTHVRVEARGSEFTVWVDGREQTRETLPDAPATGGIGLTLEDTHNIPSLPSPRGIDSVRVTDLDSGVTLFEDDFSSLADGAWTYRSGDVTGGGGLLGSRGRSMLAVTGKPWHDYAVDITYRNISAATIVLRTPDGVGGVVALVRPFWWKEDVFSRTVSLNMSGPIQNNPGAILELKRSETMSSILAMTLRPYPYVMLALLAALAAIAALQLVPLARVATQASGALASIPGWLYVALAAEAVFGVTLYLNYAYLSHMPHVPDSVAYVFQAKVLASGHLSAPAPPPSIEKAFEFSNPSFVQVFDGGKWAAVYPFGHPLLLAFGQRIGAIWLVPPLVGAACVTMLFALGRRLYNARVGTIAIALLATSPLFLMQASTFMSHNTAMFYLLASMLCLAFIDRRPAVYGLLAGIAFGLLFNTRPLTALALMPAFGALLLTGLLRREHRRTGAIEIAAFALGGLLMFGAYLLYNYGTTGDAFNSGYQASGDPTQQIGFGGAHSVAAGMQNEQLQMGFLLLVLNGWPAYVGLGFVLLPFLLGTRNGRDWFLLACAVSVMAAWMLFEGAGVMYGPRYWYEAVPFLMLLAARGADRAADLLGSAAAYLRTRSLDGDDAARRAGRAVVFALVAALIGSSVWGWLLGQHTTWKANFVPEDAQALRGFLGVDDRIERLVEQQHLHNALVLVENCREFQCYGSVFARNSPKLDGDIVYAKDIAAQREAIVAAFPGREVYVAKYSRPSLQPYQAGPVPGRSPAASTPVPLPTVEATP
jgi:hypothetical protein